MDKNEPNLTKKSMQTLPELSEIPGWHGLDKTEKKWLREHTQTAVTYFRQSDLNAIKCCAEVYKVHLFLKGKQMKFEDWAQTHFGTTGRTVFRRVQSYKRLLASASNEEILYLAEKIPGINNFGPREVANTLKRLPPPAIYESKDAWSNDVREALSEGRRTRNKGGGMLSPDDAKKEFIIIGVKLLRRSKFETPLHELAWLQKTVGMIMELRSLDGALIVERIAIPDGFMPKRGRPRKSRRTDHS